MPPWTLVPELRTFPTPDMTGRQRALEREGNKTVVVHILAGPGEGASHVFSLSLHSRAIGGFYILKKMKLQEVK